MEWTNESLAFVIPFLIQTGLGPLLPLSGGFTAFIPSSLALGAFGFLAHRFPIGSPQPRLTAFFYGLLGALLWVGVCSLDLERRYFPGFLSAQGARAPFPLSAGAWSWLAKGLNLLIAAPLLEEFFFRGFVQPFLGERLWWKAPAEKWRPLPLLITALLFSGLHTGEWFAAFFWFYWVSFFVGRTQSLWDAVLIHLGTNLGLLSLLLILKERGWDFSRLL